jgi:hypothetical protein
MDSELEGEGKRPVWFRVRLKDKQLRRIRKEEVEKNSKLKLVEYY